MSGPSFGFVAFGVLVAVLLSLNASRGWRQFVILGASLVFLWSFSHDPLAFLPLVAFLAVGYLGLRSASLAPFVPLWVVVLVVLAFFAWMKKYVFIPDSFWWHYPYVTIGVSYILFRMLHLIIEARSEPILAKVPLARYVQYLISFNTLVAGPIQDFPDFTSEQNENRGLSWSVLGEAIERIVVGLFKTNVLATLFAQWRLASLANLQAAAPGATQLTDAAATFVLYPFFLYCNFAGYIDIVVGLSLLMAWRLPENFDRPFSSTSFIDFWNRWHITLSSWLKTYVYNPVLLALLRRARSRGAESWAAVGAFFLTFFLVGVWHGQTGAFLFFGLLQGGGVSINKLYQIEMANALGRRAYRQLTTRAVYVALARGLTFSWFTFTLTWFWASWKDSLAIWSSLSVATWIVVWLGIILTSSVVLAAWEILRGFALSIKHCGRPLLYSPRLLTAWYTTLLFMVVAASLLVHQAPPEIVYKQF